MILKIVRKEALESLSSLRFMLSLVLVVSLFAASGFVFVARYREQLQDYQEGTSKNTASLREGGRGGGRGRGPALREEETDPGGGSGKPLYELAFLEQDIWRRPKALTLCAEGFEKSLPNHFTTTAFKVGLPQVKRRGSFMLPSFSDLDWVFVIATVLSFVALLLTYDAVSGEREAGTLRLTLSASVPRDKVLVGKYLGAMLTLLIPLLLGLAVNLIIVRSYGIVAITAGDWLKMLAVLLLSLVYLSVFVLLGLFISSRTRHGVSSMVILLLVWVGLVILIPSAGRLAARALGKAMTQTELVGMLSEANDRVMDDARVGKYGKNARNKLPDPNDPRNNPSGRAASQNAVTDASNRILEEYFMRAVARARTGRQATRVSPAALYQCAAEAIAGTGIGRCVDLYKQVKEYQTGLKEYIRSKDAEDPESLHLLCEDQDIARSWQAISHQPVDFDGVPKFQERAMGLGKSLRSAIWDVGLLVLMNVVLFTAAHVSFSRYDVR